MMIQRERKIMRKTIFKMVTPMITAVAMTGMLLSGCGNAVETENTQNETVSIAEEKEVALASSPEDKQTNETAEVPAAPYFAKGVYANYSAELENPEMTYFYVISGDNYGYTEDGANEGIGLPFDFEQEDGKVAFTFGGADESKDNLIVTAAKDGFIYGYFEDIPERPLVFELISGADPENFSAENYVNGPKNSVYHDANGWSFKYDADNFEITRQDGTVFVVYTGECAGTSMITITYDPEKSGEEAIKTMGESWGSENTTYTQAIFPGTEDVTGYWAMLTPSDGGSGLCETAIGRDYMGGALVFEFTEHICGDDELDMAVSDALASIIDSLSFD